MKKSLLIFLLLFVATSIFSFSNPAIELSEVDALIDQKRINEALSLVNKYLEENPDDFDNARKRVDIIFTLRTEYKEKADELIKIIVDEPLNDKKKLDIIEELEGMEANPNKEEKEFIAKIKVAAQFTYFRALYEQILKESTILLNEEKYAEAVTKLSEGFVLYYDDFFEQGFDEEIITESIETLNEVKTTFNQYTELQTKITSAFDEFNKALIENNITLAEEKYTQASHELQQFAKIRNESYLAGNTFEGLTKSLQSENPELTDAFFLPFAYRLILGRGIETEADVVKVMDKHREELYAYTLTNLSGMLSNFSTAITNNTSEKDFETIENDKTLIETDLNIMQRGITLGKNLLDQNTLVLETLTEFKTNPYIQYEAKLAYSEQLINTTQKWLDNVELYNQQAMHVASYPVPENAATSIQNKEKDYSEFLFEASKTNETNGINSQLVINELQDSKTVNDITTTEKNQSDVSYVKALTDFENAVFNNSNDILDKNFEFAVNNLEAISSFSEEGSSIIKQNYKNQFDEAIPLINEANDVLISSNPKRSQEIFDSLLSTIDHDIAMLSEELTYLQQIPDNTTVAISNSRIYNNSNESISSTIEYLENLKFDAEDSLALAQQRIRFAQQAENEANLRLNEAQKNLDNGNYSVSRDALQKARTKFNESLAYQFSEALQQESDARIAELGDKIAFAENEIIIQKVREFITESRKNYYNSNFLQAETFILQAEAQWAITNVQENPEIVSLKALISNALSITTGRTIPPTDPLYPEMSQTLNVAYQHYSTAEGLLDNNKRIEALDELESARNKIRDIQVLYPFHQEASLLALEIDKLIDPEAFKEQFALKFNQAKVDYKDPDTTTRAYIDLLDLFEINPNYPGLENFIYAV